jgi:hypothetical protein
MRDVVLVKKAQALQNRRRQYRRRRHPSATVSRAG